MGELDQGRVTQMWVRAKCGSVDVFAGAGRSQTRRSCWLDCELNNSKRSIDNLSFYQQVPLGLKDYVHESSSC